MTLYNIYIYSRIIYREIVSDSPMLLLFLLFIFPSPFPLNDKILRPVI